MISKLIRYGLPTAAVASLVFAVWYVTRSGASEPAANSSVPLASRAQPPLTPYANVLAGAGVVEPQSENISIGSATPGIVSEVPLVVGRKVKQGDLLFRMDDRQLRAELAAREAALAVAKAQLTKLENEPRPEQIAVDEARQEEAQAIAVEARRNLDRYTRLAGSNAVTEADVDVARRQAGVAEAQVNRVRAELGLLRAGAWQFDKLIAQQSILQAEADIQRVTIELQRLEVRAPRDGEVLQVNVRPGEFAGAPPDKPLIMLGSTASLHVRVDIDEQDIGRYRVGIPGVAMPRGFPDLKYPLRFQRVEPFVVPKRSLTGDNTERVDTRVLQVIYEVENNNPPLYVGQQLDVFLNLDDAGAANASD